MSKEWVVMFVDMQGSTEIKYRTTENEVGKIISRLYRVIHQVAEYNNLLKFTGDGAMIGYAIDPDESHKAPLQALRDAVKIIKNIDKLNYLFDVPPIHIRVGIASGQCKRFTEGANDLIGIKVDLASRLCAEAIADSILVDEATLKKAGLDLNSPEAKLSLDVAEVRRCVRRLSLKGVPKSDPLQPAPEEQFWDISVARFANQSNTDLFSDGLVALYQNRDQLIKDFPPERLIQTARQGSRMLVAGRTLLSWMNIAPARLVQLVTERNLKIWFMIVSEHALQYLDSDQQKAAKGDLIKVLPHFQELLELDESRNGNDPHFRLFKSDLLILDGITCTELCFYQDVKIGDNGEDPSDFSRHIALQDINATAQRTVAISDEARSEAVAKAKAAIVWACICPDGNPQKSIKPCMAHGLERRTEVLFDKANPMSVESVKLDLLLKQQGEGLGSRNNHPRNYLSWMAPYLRCIREGRFTEVPAPISVQMQVCSRCSTHCRMCDHWIDGEKNHSKELPLDRWRLIFTDLAQFGVRTAIFSGGEPLERDDIIELLWSARRAGLRVGLLTNGMIDKPEQKAREIHQAIADCADWVAISVDGTETVDERIRNLQLKVLPKTDSNRKELLRNFCAGIRGINPKVKLSATVTLQSHNIGMDLDDACRFIKEELTIPQVNFKFATGARNALTTTHGNDYQLSEREVSGFLNALKRSHLPQEQGNNLAYLTRTVDREVYSVRDIAEGAPVQTYYVKNEFRCFTPFLFSLIDYDGEVYTCCHLYRDNHVEDDKTKDYRAEHSMGSLKTDGVDFNSIWNGPKYAAERKQLTRIDPRQEHFEPCGECTRHCQHNSVVTGVEKLYNEAPTEVEKALKELEANHDPVWF